jgi:hypothetical protein
MDLAPGPKIGASPGFTYDPRAGLFDPDNILLIRYVTAVCAAADKMAATSRARAGPESW